MEINMRKILDMSLMERNHLYAEAIKLHTTFGYGILKIGKKLNLSPSTVYGWIYKGCKPSKVRKVKITKELLEELYLKKCLPQRKIAKLFSVDSKTIHYWLVKFNIPRRLSPRQLGRLRDEVITKEKLISFYVDKEYSIQKIAKLFNVSCEAVRQRLIKYNIKRRNSQYQQIYPKKQFSKDGIEASYLLGLRTGDLYVSRRSSRRIRISVSTTHPAMIELFFDLFKKYGKVNTVPVKPRKDKDDKFSKARTYSWQAYVDVDSSFNFLLEKPTRIPSWINTPEKSLAFIAGYTDAEGSIKILRGTHRKCVKVALNIKSKDNGILEEISSILRNMGFHPVLCNLSSGFKELSVNRKNEFFNLMKILPIKHREKIEARELAFFAKDKKWEEVENLVKKFREKVKKERLNSINEAQSEWERRHPNVCVEGETTLT